MVKIRHTFGDQPGLVSELIDYLYSVEGEKMLTTVELARLLREDKGRERKIADLVSYIANNRDGLYGSKSLWHKVEAKRVLVSSSDGEEHRCSHREKVQEIWHELDDGGGEQPSQTQHPVL